MEHLVKGLIKDYEGDEETQAMFQGMIDAMGCPKKMKKFEEDLKKKGEEIEEATRRCKKRTREIEAETRRLEEARRLKKSRSTASPARSDGSSR